MSNIEPFVLDLTIIMIAAGIVALIFKKLKQPVVLGYIIAGFLISPNFTHLPTVVSVEDIHIWSELGIVFLMFGLGLEFSFKKIQEVGGSAIITAFTVMSAMIAAGYALGLGLGWDKMDAIFLGGMLSMSSTMIILKTYGELGKLKENYASVVLGALVIEDIGGIFMMIILSTIAVGKGASDGVEIVVHLGQLLLYLVLWFILGTYLIPTVLKKTNRLLNDELLLVLSIAICFGMVIIANLIGFSSALGAFMAGSIIAGTVIGQRVDRIITPVKDMFGAVFFISVGMLIQPELMLEYIRPIVLIALVTAFGQLLFSTVGILISGHSLRTAVGGGFSMVQIGEFSFILAALGTTLGVTSDFLYPIVVCVSVITSFATPVFMKSAPYAYRFLDKHLPQRARTFLDKYTSDRKRSINRENEWIEYLKKYVIRTAVCGSGMLVIYILCTRYVGREAIQAFGHDTGALVTLFVMTLGYVPLISVMHWKRNMSFTKLWLSNQMNRLPLTVLQALRTLLSVIVIMSSIRHYFMLPIPAAVVLGVAVVVLVLRSNFMSSTAIRMEHRFLSNFSEKQLALRKKNIQEKGEEHKFIDEKLHVCEVRIISEPKNKTVRALAGSRWLDILIIKIIREDGTVINMPNADVELEKGCILHVLGKEDGISSFLMLVDNIDTVEMIGSDYMTLKEYRYAQIFQKVAPENTLVCCPVPVYKESSYANKPIRSCGFRHNYKGFIIGVERDNLPIINPSVDTYILPGDLLWVIGTHEMADKLLLRGILEEKNVIQY